ncbi:hypothetical protein Q7P36_001472 [Cladosporium allicinum]
MFATTLSSSPSGADIFFYPGYYPHPSSAFDCSDPPANIAPLLFLFVTLSIELSVDVPVQNRPAAPLTRYELFHYVLRVVTDLPSPPAVPIRRVGLYDNRLASLSVPTYPTALLAVLLQFL